MEANLLRYLVAHEGKAVSRKAMLEDVWGVHEDTDTRAIDNFIVRLRRHIEKEPGRPRHLLTVRERRLQVRGEALGIAKCDQRQPSPCRHDPSVTRACAGGRAAPPAPGVRARQ